MLKTQVQMLPWHETGAAPGEEGALRPGWTLAPEEHLSQSSAARSVLMTPQERGGECSLRGVLATHMAGGVGRGS